MQKYFLIYDALFQISPKVSSKLLLYFIQKLLSFKAKNTILRVGKGISVIAHVDNTFRYNLKHNREYKYYGTRTVYSGNRYASAAQKDGDHHEQRG